MSSYNNFFFRSSRSPSAKIVMYLVAKDDFRKFFQEIQVTKPHRVDTPSTKTNRPPVVKYYTLTFSLAPPLLGTHLGIFLTLI